MSILSTVTNKDLAQKILDMHRDNNEHLNNIFNRLGELGNGIGEQADKIRNQAAKLEQVDTKLELQLKKNTTDQVAALVDEKIQQLVEQVQQHAASLLGEQATRYSDADSSEKLLRAASGRIFNRDKPSTNCAYSELLKLAKDDVVADSAWQRPLAEALVEAASIPGAAQLFERQAYLDDYLADIIRKFGARYSAGWVTSRDALFLYWLVRLTKPRNIVQCGAFNGRASAFMMLALAKNGPEGTLNIIDAPPPIFDPANPQWTIAGKYYSTVIPTGKSSAWLVPDQYRDRVNIRHGEVRQLLPEVVGSLDAVDLFYYTSDHLYHPMVAAFEDVRPKLSSGGLAVVVDAGWNAALWEFADKHGVPSHTFKNAVGVGFF